MITSNILQLKFGVHFDDNFSSGASQWFFLKYKIIHLCYKKQTKDNCFYNTM